MRWSPPGIEIDVGERYGQVQPEARRTAQKTRRQVMGGALFTLADFCLRGGHQFQAAVTVTTKEQISLSRRRQGDVLCRRAGFLKDGKRVCFYEIVVMDNLGNARGYGSQQWRPFEREGLTALGGFPVRSDRLFRRRNQP